MSAQTSVHEYIKYIAVDGHVSCTRVRRDGLISVTAESHTRPLARSFSAHRRRNDCFEQHFGIACCSKNTSTTNKRNLLFKGILEFGHPY